MNAGKLVTVSRSNIEFQDWNGCGYIILDPETGAGAYMISGGLSGAYLLTFINFMSGALGAVGTINLTARVASGVLAPLWAVYDY